MEDRRDRLYILRYIIKGMIDDTVVKIGRSASPETRRKALESCQNFRIDLGASFPHWGKYEHAVHQRLAYAQSSDGAGTEWFNVSLAEAVKAIGETVLQETTEERPSKRLRVSEEPENDVVVDAPLSMEESEEESAALFLADDLDGVMEEDREDDSFEGEDVPGEDQKRPDGVLNKTFLSNLIYELSECKSRKNGNPLTQACYQSKVHKVLAHYKASKTQPQVRTRMKLPGLKDIFDREFG